MEAAGLIRRLPDPNDRRGTLVEPTERATTRDATVGASARSEARRPGCSARPRRLELHDLLRDLMQAFPDWKQKKHSLPVADTDD